jgi:hypothetical protein
MNNIIDICCKHNGVVYGSWVRDVLVRQVTYNGNVNIALPRENFEIFKKEIYESYKTTINSFFISSNNVKQNHIIIFTNNNDCIVLIIELFECMIMFFHQQESELSCNLFYTDAQTHIGLLYVPEKYEKLANPVQKLLEDTKNKELSISLKETDSIQISRLIDELYYLFQKDWKFDKPYFTLVCENIECPICLEHYCEQVNFSCKHSFCFDCTKRFLAIKPECPLCRDTTLIS